MGAYAQNDCKKPVYLTFDTGHMAVAPLVADVLKRQQVHATFFAANERTQEGDGSLGDHWAPWWKAMAGQGHEFASHTIDHAYWRGDVADRQGGATRFRIVGLASNPAALALYRELGFSEYEITLERNFV